MNNCRTKWRLDALKAKAAKSVETILKHHPASDWRDEYVARNSDWRAHRYPGLSTSGRWSDDGAEFYADHLDALPGRQIGQADDVCKREGSRRVDHSGWYTDDDCRATVSGYVLQLPARDGATWYYPALAWSECDGVTAWPRDRYADAVDAAGAADRHAELFAEKERDYQAAWQAGQRWSEAGETVAALRAEALTLLQERRAICREFGAAARDRFAASIGALETAIRAKVDGIGVARQERENLASGYWQADAFNEGAGVAVI